MMENVDLEIELANVKDWADRINRNRRANAGMAILAGNSLLRVKDFLPHGDWLGWLSQTAVSERVAQNWMRLARAGLSADDVMELGGIQKALDSLSTPRINAYLEGKTLLTPAEAVALYREGAARVRELEASNRNLQEDSARIATEIERDAVRMAEQDKELEALESRLKELQYA